MKDGKASLTLGNAIHKKLRPDSRSHNQGLIGPHTV